MNPKERIQKNIEGLEGLLTLAIRVNQPKYQRELRKDIEGLQREWSPVWNPHSNPNLIPYEINTQKHSKRQG